MAGRLYSDDMSSKVAAVTAGVFGIAFHGVLAAVFFVRSSLLTLRRHL